MKGILIILFVAACIFSFIYFGYYQDYKRNPKEFKRSIIGMPLGIIVRYLGLISIDRKLKNWANVVRKR